MSAPIKIGIIGGSGLSNPDMFTITEEVKSSTEFGDPSDLLLEGTIEGIPCVLLARHGRGHSVMPSSVNFRANLLSLRDRGCTHVLAATACGSLREGIRAGEFVIIDQFIDRTTLRKSTFFDGTSTSKDFAGILHLPMDAPFCERTRNILTQSCKALDYPVHPQGTMVTVEGPRFSSKAESKMYRIWGADVINMTTVPEVVLARELGLCYAALAMVTDADSWEDGENVVSVDIVMATMKKNASRGLDVFKRTIVEIGKQDWTDTIAQMKANVTHNTMMPK